MTTFLAAVLMVLVLSGITWVLLGKYARTYPYAKRVFLLALCVHVVAAFGIYYAEFYPFGTGDQERYQRSAELIASDFQEGVFSLERISSNIQITTADHWYPVVLGGVYAVSVADPLVGMALNAWIAAVSVLLVFFLAFEISKSPRGAFWAGIVAAFYPAHVYFGSLLLKDALVVLLALAGTLFVVKILEHFSVRYVIAFGIVLALLFHFRFYIGIAVLYAFSFSWPFIQGFDWKQKARYGVFTLLSLGLIPSLFGYGYYALGTIGSYTHIDQIALYREAAYVFETPSNVQKSEEQPEREGVDAKSPEPAVPAPVQTEKKPAAGEKPAKEDSGESTVIVEVGDSPLSFIRNYLVSFSFVSLGPFPWHFSKLAHYFALLETVPWWILVFFIARGVIRKWRNWQGMLPLFLIALIILSMLGLIVASNFGVYMRLRIPAFLALISLLSFAYPILQSRLQKREVSGRVGI